MAEGVAFLIDADNLNDPAAVADAFERLHALAGPSTVRRAYGSTDSLKGLAPVLKQYAVRPCANFVLDKNTTDLALVVDAMELACLEQPSVLALGSGDSDFYPLVVRLRERGVRVMVFALEGKVSDDMRTVCSELFFVGAPAVARRPVPRKVATKKAAPKAPAEKKPVAKKNPVKKPLEPSAVPVPASASARGLRQAAAGKAGVTVDGILHAVPVLREGAALRLNEVAQQLHKAAVLGKSASSVKLFQRFREHFELTPDSHPTHVRWLQGAEA